MPFQLNAIPDEQNVQEAIALGEGQQIELRERIAHALDLGKLVSGFANANGGWIIIGVQEPDTAVGVNLARVNQAFDNVNSRLKPAQEISMHAVTLNGVDVRVVVVNPSDGLVVTDAGAFIREGERTRPMTADEIRARIAAQPPAPPAPPPQPAPVDDCAERIARLTGTVDELMRKFDASQTWTGQTKGFWVGVAASTLSSGLVALIVLIWGVV